MKYLTIILLISTLSCPAMAQEQTLFNGKVESGWYGGPLIKVGQMNGETGFFAGIQGGWIINHSFVLGGKGYMLVNPFEIKGLQNIVVGFGCGGILIEYIISSDKLLHFKIESLIGIGGVYNDVKTYSKYHDPIDFTGDACFVLEPGVNLTLNVSKNMRISAGVTYRFVSGIRYDPGDGYVAARDYDLISDSDLRNISAQLIFEFGVF
jgi:hypothetical protein